MSRKPPKKSDMGKSWMKPRRDSQQMISPEYHALRTAFESDSQPFGYAPAGLGEYGYVPPMRNITYLIVSEGTKTEPKYFEKIKATIDAKYRNRIHLDISAKGNNTINLFHRAVKDVARSNIVYKHVWLVFDKDDFPSENFDHTAELCAAESTDETRYHPIWSNQCIELWFLLHFMFLQADLHRDEYWPKLNECLESRNLGCYYKNRTDMFDVLRPYMDDAIRNANKLEEINTGKSPSRATPGTMVHHLIEILKPYL